MNGTSTLLQIARLFDNRFLGIGNVLLLMIKRRKSVIIDGNEVHLKDQCDVMLNLPLGTMSIVVN